MPFSQLVALMKANTGRVRLFVAVICRPFAMDECFSSSDGAKLRVDGRDSFPSPSLRDPQPRGQDSRVHMDGILSRPLR